MILSSATAQNNATLGGNPGLGGSTYGLGFGGGIYAAGGSVTLCGDTVESNSVDGYGGGGGIYIAGGTVYIETAAVDPLNPRWSPTTPTGRARTASRPTSTIKGR